MFLKINYEQNCTYRTEIGTVMLNLNNTFVALPAESFKLSSYCFIQKNIFEFYKAS